SSYSSAFSVVYDLITNQASFANISTNFAQGSGVYSDGSTIFFHVHSLGGGSGSYSLLFHL
ncbi:MAG: hypothetical protein QOE91_759, partial [Gaiellaceae bacterium]|nr:hypothetical protein [Gaiellaceae bacterium]